MSLAPVFAGMWAEIHHVKSGDQVLKAVCNGVAPYSLDLPPYTIQRALKSLIDASMLSKGSGRGNYQLIEPLFGDWILRQE